MEHQHRIKLWVGAALVLTAFSADLLEMLLEWLGVGLVINVVTTPAYAFLFWLWFKMLDVPFIASPKKFFTLAATCLAEIIPALDALGGFFWTLGTLIIVVMVRMEDKGGVVGAVSGTATGVMRVRHSANRELFNRPGNPQQIARDLRKERPDLAIKREELVTGAMKRGGQPDTQLNRDKYEKGVDEFKGNIENVLNLKQKKELSKKA